MSECSAVREGMPLLLTESLDATRRELTHQHIESCGLCGAEWEAYRDTWAIMGDLPEVEVPAHVKQQFLERAGLAEKQPDNVVPFTRRPTFKWIAQAAAIAVIAGGSYFVGDRNAERVAQSPVTLNAIRPAARDITPVSLAETRVLDASSLSPDIQGRPNITNVQCVDCDDSDGKISVSFDVTSRWTVTGDPKDRSMVRLAAYVTENQDTLSAEGAREWLRTTYSDPANADPEIAHAWAKVLRSDDSHEGLRIGAVESLTHLPASTAAPTRDALIEALKSDPNPAVRIKAVEALANLARSGAALDSAMVDTLRQKAAQGDENMYVRVKAAEALKSINTQQQ